MTTTPPADTASAAVTLAPRPWVALAVIALGAATLLPAPDSGWLRAAAGVVGLFGVFLLIQTLLLRLRFDEEALLVLRAGSEIRRFPYEAWLGWRLFFTPVPVLFYFREERSIHLLPVLFDAASLREQLRRRLPALAPSQGR
jgi:hypothetical protein